MSDEEKAIDTNVQATDHSTAIGKIEISGSVEGNVIIGGTYNITQGRTSETIQLPGISNTITAKYYEPETILIPEGQFCMGSNLAEGIPGYETPQHEVFLPAYCIGKYPVTNRQYEEFIRDTHRQVSHIMGWDGQRLRQGTEDHPVAGVTWYEAVAYCNWLGEKTGRKYALPSEAQWEKACRGGKKTIYPWGEEFIPERCNQGRSTLAKWNAYPEQNEYGCLDLVGNLRQWTITLWGEKRIAPDPRFAYPWKDDRRNDINASRQFRRVIRGSSFAEAAADLRCSIRNGQLPEDASWTGAGIGFRVVMSV